MPIMTIINAFAMLIGVGATAAISITLGQRHRDKAENVLGNAVSLSFLSGFIILAIGILFSTKILTFFGASSSTLPFAETYIYIILLGTPINIIGYALNNITRADGSPRISAAVMGLSCLSNIVLDWLFVFKLNFGIAGAAYATVISQTLTLIAGLHYFINSSKEIRLKLKSMKLKLHPINQIYSIGMSPFVTMLLASVIQILNNKVLKIYGGDYAIGAMATISSISIMSLMPLQGIAQGAQPIIGFNYGAKKYDRAFEALKLSALTAVGLMFMLLAFLRICPEFVIGFFGGDDQLKEIALHGMKIYILGIPAIAIGINVISYFQAIGNAKLALFFSLLRQLVLLIPILLIASKYLGLDGVWLAQPISDILAAGIVLYFLKLELNRQKRETNFVSTLETTI
jgi:putative MATE family efflux protein